MRVICAAFAAFVLAFAVAAQAQVPVNGPTTYHFTTSSQYNIWNCNGGQSTAQVNIPAGLTGVFTITVGQTAVSPSPANTPPYAYAPGSSTNTNTITNSGSLTVILGSNGYVEVADTTYGSGSTYVSVVCSASGAAIPPAPASSGGGSENSTIVAPTDGNGNVKVTTPAPAGTVYASNLPTPVASPSTNGIPNTGVNVPVLAILACQNQGSGVSANNSGYVYALDCNSSHQGPTLKITICGPGTVSTAATSVCAQPQVSPNATATAIPVLPVAQCAPGATTYCQTVDSNQHGGIVPFAPTTIAKLAINSSSTTGCQSISTTAKALVSVTAAYNTAQTTDLALYDEGATPTCAAADQLYDPTFGGAQVVNWTELGLTLSNGLAYKATTASILGNIWVQYR